MKSIFRRVVPKTLRQKRRELKYNKTATELQKFDNERFLKHAFVKDDLTFEQLEAKLTKEYHSIEKGLSYKNLRLGFGKKVLQNTIELMKEYRRQGYPLDSHVYTTALSNLEEYIKVHEENNFQVPQLKEIYQKLKLGTTHGSNGGAFWATKKDLLQKAKGDFKEFSLSRHSIRDYSDEPVSMETIEAALKLASHSPSACNRQSWKIRIVKDPQMKKIIQKNQNGNRGFGDYIDKFIIITSDVQYYDRLRERNQANIDGGMYAMNLLYALHYYEVAAIPLSASLKIEQETNLRSAFNIPDSENFIMFIGVGNYIDDFKLAKSDRRSINYKIF